MSGSIPLNGIMASHSVPYVGVELLGQPKSDDRVSPPGPASMRLQDPLKRRGCLQVEVVPGHWQHYNDRTIEKNTLVFAKQRQNTPNAGIMLCVVDILVVISSGSLNGTKGSTASDPDLQNYFSS